MLAVAPFAWPGISEADLCPYCAIPELRLEPSSRLNIRRILIQHYRSAKGEEVVVWFASFENAEALAASVDRLSRSDRWAHANSELETYLKAPPKLLRLRPTGRSLLR